MPLRAEGWNFWLKRVPLEAIMWSSRAAELQAAVGPWVSRPWAGPTPSAIGVLASLPSGVAPVWEPRGTLAETG